MRPSIKGAGIVKILGCKQVPLFLSVYGNLDSYYARVGVISGMMMWVVMVVVVVVIVMVVVVVVLDIALVAAFTFTINDGKFR